MTVEIQTLENARYGRDEGYAYLYVEVNGRPCRVYREKALRLDGSVAALEPWDDFRDFFVVLPPDPEDGRPGHYKLEGYTSDRRYVALVWQFVEAVDNGTFHEGPVEIPR